MFKKKAQAQYLPFPIFAMCTFDDKILLSGGGGGKEFGLLNQLQLFTLSSQLQQALHSIDTVGGDAGVIQHFNIDIAQKKHNVLKRLVGHNATVLGISCHPYLKQCISTSMDKTCRIWDYLAGVCVKQLDFAETHTAPSLFIRNAIFSPNGKQIYTASSGVRKKENSYLNVWSINQKGDIQPVQSKSIYNGALSQAALSKDGKYMGIGTSDGCIKIYKLNSKITEVTSVQSHKMPATSLDFISNNSALLSGSADFTFAFTANKTSICLFALAIKLLILSLVVYGVYSMLY